MQALHTRAAVSATFDDSNLVSCAGLVPLLRLAADVGLAALADERVRLGVPVGANAGAKVASIVAGMAAGADSIDDLDVLRHGALPELFGGIRAPSTLGSFLRGFTHGHGAQLAAVAREVLVRLAGRTTLLEEVGKLAFLDIDSKIFGVYGRAKQGAAHGYTGVWGLNVLAVTVSSLLSARVMVASRLRGGNADTGRGAASLLRQALGTARACGATGELIVRGDSGYYRGALIKAITQGGASFSITARQTAAVRASIAAIGATAWKPVRYAHPVYDETSQEWFTTAEIAEIGHTAFTNPTDHPDGPVAARLLVRRRRITTRDEQGELFTAWRYHAVFTNSGFDLPTALAHHDGRAGTIEQVYADLADSALTHLPSGRFAANDAWLTLAGITHNLTRALGCLASTHHTRARTATIRRQLITVPARLAHSARRLTLHLPQAWPWQHAWHGAFDATHRAPPTPAA